MKEVIVSEKYNIKANFIEVGEDLCVIVSGGDAPHIGAVSAAALNPGVGAAHLSEEEEKLFAMSKGEDGPAFFESVRLPAHRDNAVSDLLAKRLSEKYQKNVVVVAGIHVDGLSKEGIDEVMALIDEFF